jgi:hypothetical protein
MTLFAIKLLREETRTWSIYLVAFGRLGEWMKNMVLHTSSVEATYLSGVCVILILKA